jgi:hypothetical protein
MSDHDRCDCGGQTVKAVPGYECEPHPLSELRAVQGFVVDDATRAFMDWEEPHDGSILVPDNGAIRATTIYVTPDDCAAYADPEAIVRLCTECGDWDYR